MPRGMKAARNGGNKLGRLVVSETTILPDTDTEYVQVHKARAQVIIYIVATILAIALVVIVSLGIAVWELSHIKAHQDHTIYELNHQKSAAAINHLSQAR